MHVTNHYPPLLGFPLNFKLDFKLQGKAGGGRASRAYTSKYISQHSDASACARIYTLECVPDGGVDRARSEELRVLSLCVVSSESRLETQESWRTSPVWTVFGLYGSRGSLWFERYELFKTWWYKNSKRQSIGVIPQLSFHRRFYSRGPISSTLTAGLFCGGRFILKTLHLSRDTRFSYCKASLEDFKRSTASK